MMFLGCGPIMSTQTITDARDALERAAEVDAERYATYEYVSAFEYLEKAREEWGYSDYQKALEYARRAVTFAEQAYERAHRNPMRNAPVIDDVIGNEW